MTGRNECSLSASVPPQGKTNVRELFRLGLHEEMQRSQQKCVSMHAHFDADEGQRSKKAKALQYSPWRTKSIRNGVTAETATRMHDSCVTR